MNRFSRMAAGAALLFATLIPATTIQAQSTSTMTNLLPFGAQPASVLSGTNNTLRPLGLSIQFSQGNGPTEVGNSIKILVLMTILSLAPSLIIMTTSFTRILIVFSFLRQALGTQNTPPGQVMTGMAIFLTIFIMAPVWKDINANALQPYMNGQMTQEEAWQKGVTPLKSFMLKQTGKSELALFIELSGNQSAQTADDLGLEVVIPSFMISELKTAFQLGFLIYLPFLVIDLVVSTSLMALGMMMLPPMMISLPIKILFFVLADGWVLLVRNLVLSFKT